MKLSGALPKGDKNGLALLDEFVANDPETRHVVLMVLSTKKITKDIDTGDTEALLRVVRCERVLPGDAETVEKVLRRALQKRSGMTVLPIDMEDDIAEIFREAMISTTLPEPGENPQGVVDDDPEDSDAA